MNTKVEEALKHPFGTVFTEQMAVSHFKDGEWSPFELEPVGPIPLHPASHVLHYSSTCFEGLKVHRGLDGVDRVFRLQRHIQRMQGSANLLHLPVPEAQLLEDMIRTVVGNSREWIPEHPGSLYVRPTLIGTQPSIGAAAEGSKEAMLYILLSPVGNYFKEGPKPIRILVDDIHMRTSPDFGCAKTGGNYASALRLIEDARSEFGVTQVLFAPGGDVQETGAANFLMIREGKIRTKSLDGSFLHGVTRDSLLRLAEDMGYEVVEDEISTPELMEWVKDGEAALSGTAAILAGIGTLIYKGKEYQVGDGNIGPHTMKLRQALVDVHNGSRPDKFNWLSEI